jgi:hypothetical protein
VLGVERGQKLRHAEMVRRRPGTMLTEIKRADRATVRRSW